MIENKNEKKILIQQWGGVYVIKHTLLSWDRWICETGLEKAFVREISITHPLE